MMPGLPLISPSALLDALFDNATVGLGVWDPELRCERVNARLAAINGVPVADHFGRRPSELLPGLGARLEALLRQVLETGEPLRDVEISGETPAAVGVRRQWLAHYFPVREGDGAPVGVGALVVEVTAERDAHVRADSAMQRSAFMDAELRTLYAALPVGVAFLSPDLRYQRVNATLAQLNGRSVEEHVGASLEDVLGEHAAGLRAQLERVIASGESLDIELSIALPQDPEDVRALEATFFPVADGGEELLGLGAVIRDVTRRHQLEVEQAQLLRDALFARAAAEAAGVRTDDARQEAERTMAEAERGRTRLGVLAQAGRRMAESMEWESTLQAVVHSVVPGVADWASLTVLEPHGELRVHAIAHSDPAREQLAWTFVERFPQDEATARVIRSGELEVLRDIPPEVLRAAAQDAEHLRLLENLGPRHVAIAPLVTPRGVVGALTFVLGESGRRFEDEDLQLIRSLASRASLHIENARLYTERSAIAQTLQASLLPRALPRIKGASLASFFRPAGDQNTVGGDFYDVFRGGDGVWVAVVGDVSGKGASAAALTALARNTLRATARTHDDPRTNLTLLNLTFHEDTEARDFCSVFYARICPGPDGLDVRFASGGHPPAMLVRPDGEVRAIEAGNGPLIGAFRESTYQEATLTIAPGELLLLYTDGVTEVRMSDVELGERELHTTLSRNAAASPQELVAAVAQRAVELQDGAPRDDIALLAIRADLGTVAS